MNMRFYISLIESYQSGFKTFMGLQCDVFRNPSRKEWKEVEGKERCVRAFLLENDILIWNTYSALHQMVREELNLQNDAIPLVIYGKPGQDCLVMITDNTRDTIWWHNPAVVDQIETHPYMKKFLSIDVSFYDEDVEGDWRNLDDSEDEDED